MYQEKSIKKGRASPASIPEAGGRELCGYNIVRDKPRTFLIHDVTLRDGEQQAGVSFSAEDKVAIALELDAIGVPRIEAGRLDGPPADVEIVRGLAALNLRAELWGVARATKRDVERALAARLDGIGLVVLAHPHHLARSRMSAATLIAEINGVAEIARMGGLKVSLLIADSARLDPETLRLIIQSATGSWLYDGIGLMDSVGVLSPGGSAQLVRSVRGLTDLKLEIHAHNDFGMGVANALAALDAGADVAHASVLGLGERVGNTSLEELAVAAPMLSGLDHAVDLGGLSRLCQTVARAAGVTITANKPVVGSSFAQVESGFVAAEILQLRESGGSFDSLYPFLPGTVGGGDIELVVGKSSGPANLEPLLTKLGVTLSETDRAELLSRCQALAVREQRTLNDMDIRELLCDLAVARLGWLRA